MTEKINLAICSSGRGSNAEAIIRYSLKNEAGFRTALLISNNSKAEVMSIAASYGVPGFHLSSVTHPDPRDYEQAFLQALDSCEADMIALAGYMKKIPEAVIRRYKGRIFNIHPALLPKFGGEGMYGINVHRAVLEAGERESGITVHLVEGDYDTGEIIRQERVEVLETDTPESLANRLLALEHRVYPEVLDEMSRRLGKRSTL